MAIRLQEPYEAVPPADYVNLRAHAKLRIRHPGYDDANNELLSLVAADCASGGDDGLGVGGEEQQGNRGQTRYGIQYQLVHAACAIVAGNRFDGVISRQKDWDNDHSLPLDPAALLPTGDYYFHVPNERQPLLGTENPVLNLNPPYPVVPNFRSWSFPTDQFRDSPALRAWTSTTIAPASDGDQSAKERDVSCRLTHHHECVQMAHIVPTTEAHWFMSNDMGRMSVKDGKDAIEIGNENLILLRADVHTIWDRSDFSIVPKMDTTSVGKWAVHVHKLSGELHYLYHNRPMQSLKGINGELLFARFAYDIFPKLRGFLQRGVKRCLLVSGESKSYKAEDCETFCEHQGRHRSTSPRKSKSGSPAKRPRTDDDEHQERDKRETDRVGSENGDSAISLQDCSGSSDGHESDDPYGYKRRADQADLEEQLSRGRKRVRRNEPGVHLD
ncbi:uncharacterized protein MYCGRDRAFT_111745 [Zymoseptoria tritici IPO323]|uniref:HNH nuclease domain-containing protein n=1 Tax=Zymoseptoria tritici (strain CBS 115943 / IPO323) TaxID=336722 RepID=F9XQV5_ZYMTI|nr:uncharacterized protein MYCGRDRAFT_111745 [Zymoseptoria tritici IPO323]EGP82353.1 hypothetical protein MYCGRDRAFT_111745 [Zymoseptoria tritici IPO323]